MHQTKTYENFAPPSFRESCCRSGLRFDVRRGARIPGCRERRAHNPARQQRSRDSRSQQRRSTNSATNDAKPAPAHADHAIAKMIRGEWHPKFGEVYSPAFSRSSAVQRRPRVPRQDGRRNHREPAARTNIRTKKRKQRKARHALRFDSLALLPSQRRRDRRIFCTVLHENPDKKIFVHCELGSDRTGMSIAAYRISAQGWSAEEAMKEMQAFGFSGAHSSLAGDWRLRRTFPSAFKSTESMPLPRSCVSLHRRSTDSVRPDF